MFDNRFPNLVRVRDYVQLPAHERAMLQKRLDRVYARTDFTGVVDTCRTSLFFYIGDVESGAALDWDLTSLCGASGDTTAKHLDDLWVDRVCKALQRGRAPWRVKQQAMAWAEQSAKTDELAERTKARCEREKQVAKELARTKNRFGMSTKYRPSAVVDGLKAGAST